MKTVSSITIGLLIISSVLMADFFQNMTDKYVGGGIVFEDIEDTDTDGVGGEVKIGGVILNGFGAEAKLTKSLSPAEADDYDDTIDVDITTLSLYGTYNFRLIPEFTVMPKLGLTYFYTSLDSDYDGSDSDGNFNLSYGFDMKYMFSNLLSGYFGVTIYNPEYKGYNFDATQVSIGIEKSF